jgi:hypothetical protein
MDHKFFHGGGDNLEKKHNLNPTIWNKITATFFLNFSDFVN